MKCLADLEVSEKFELKRASTAIVLVPTVDPSHDAELIIKSHKEAKRSEENTGPKVFVLICYLF